MAKFDSQYSKLYVNQFDLSTYSTDVSIGGGRGLNEITTFGSSGATFHPTNQTESLSWSGFYDTTATSGPDAVLGDLRTSSTAAVVSYFPAGDTIEYIGEGIPEGFVNTYEIGSSVGSVVTATSTIDAGNRHRTKVAAPYATVTATTTGTSIDDAAGTTSGIRWFYHVFALSGTWTLKLQHSSNNSTWVDLVVSSVSAIGAYSAESTGTFNRYVRSNATLSGSGSITYGISYTRL